MYLKEPDSYSMSERRAACAPNSCMPKTWKARLIQGAASEAVAHSAGYGAPVQVALPGAMAAMSAVVRGAMLQAVTGVAMRRGTATEKMTNSALGLMVGFAESWYEKAAESEPVKPITNKKPESCIRKR